ncbi:MAG TPA: hypothetical protein VN622_07870 [Clostridia bacterium]|nr:hypothetical protein [Clostridia bacterium]
MGSLSPLATSLLIICSVAFVGAFLAYFRDRRMYAGHQGYAAEARTLAKKLNGELFRDGEDLVVSGELGRLPAVIRFSYGENTPGMNIRVNAPATFTMSIVPKGASATEGRVLVRTPDDMFDARFVTRSDHPTQAKMLLSSRGAMALLKKICCSSNTYITVANGGIELSELAIPAPYTLRHILDHFEELAALASELGRMPGADRLQVKPVRRERRLALRTAILVGTIAALVGVITASRTPTETPLADIVGEAPPNGVTPIDALRISGVNKWHVAIDSELEPDAAAWLRSFGIKTNGRAQGSYDHDGPAHDTAYLLVGEKGERRVVIVTGGENRYDITYPYIGAIARVPKSAFRNTAWVNRPATEPDGDGLLIIRKPQDRASGLVLYFSGSRLASAAPVDYQTLKLLE